MVKIPKTKQFTAVKKTVNKVSKPKMVNLYNLTRFSGVEPKENLPKYAELKHTTDIESLMKELSKIKEHINLIGEKSFSEIKKMGDFITVLINKNLKKSVLEELKKERLAQKICLQNSNVFSKRQNKIPNTEIYCNDIPLKQMFIAFQDSILLSPRLQMHYILGEKTSSHYEKVKHYERLFGSKNITELLRQKTRILNEFKKYTNEKNLTPDFVYSKEKLAKLKLNVQKFDAIDNLLKKYNIQTSAIETLFYSGIEKILKPGNILPNQDLMLGFVDVYDRSLKKNVPAILTFANTDVGYRFKIFAYDKELIGNVEKYKKQVSHFLKTQNYKGINDLNKKILEYLKNIQIAEVYFDTIDKAELIKKMKHCPDMTEQKINKILNATKSDTVHLVTDLINFNLKRYYNTSITLIKKLKEFAEVNKIKDKSDIYTEAMSFNKVKHSPVGLYMKAGFEPISIPREEIEKTLFTKEGFDYKRNVWLIYKS